MYRRLKYKRADLNKLQRELETTGLPLDDRKLAYFKRRMSLMISRAMVDKAERLQTKLRSLGFVDWSL